MKRVASALLLLLLLLLLVSRSSPVFSPSNLYTRMRPV